MIKLVISSVILAATWQSAATDGARTALRTCIKTASTEVKGKKMAEDAFSAFVHSKCTTQETGFKSAMWSFDSKNKVSRKQSESDAQLQIDDLVTVAAEHYTMEETP